VSIIGVESVIPGLISKEAFKDSSKVTHHGCAVPTRTHSGSTSHYPFLTLCSSSPLIFDLNDPMSEQPTTTTRCSRCTDKLQMQVQYERHQGFLNSLKRNIALVVQGVKVSVIGHQALSLREPPLPLLILKVLLLAAGIFFLVY